MGWSEIEVYQYDTALSDDDKLALLENRVMTGLLLRITEIDKNNPARTKYVYDCMNETNPEKIRQINKDIMRINSSIEDYRQSIKKMSDEEYKIYHDNIWKAFKKDNNL